MTMIRPFTPQFEYFILVLAAGIALLTYLSLRYWRAFGKHEDRPQWIILYACSLQGIWGFSLFFIGKSDIAAWAGLRLMPDWVLASSFIVASSLCYYALIASKSIIWMLPQQGLMMIAGMGCVTLVIMGRYADGVEYPRIFILRDQLPEILTAIWHTCAIFHRERLRLWKKYRDQLVCGETT